MAIGRVTIIVAFFLSVFGGLWYGVVTALSKIGGWSSMAQRFSAAPSVVANWPPPGDEYWFRSMVGRWGVNYRNCMMMVVSDDGLFLKPLYPLFHFSHPPLHVPWDEMANVSEAPLGAIGWFTGPRLSVEFKDEGLDPTGFTLFPGTDALEKLRRHVCVSGLGRSPCPRVGHDDVLPDGSSMDDVSGRGEL